MLDLLWSEINGNVYVKASFYSQEEVFMQFLYV